MKAYGDVEVKRDAFLGLILQGCW